MLTENDRRLHAERMMAINEIRFEEERARMREEIKFWQSMCDMKTQAVRMLNANISELQKQATAVADAAYQKEAASKCGTIL